MKISINENIFDSVIDIMTIFFFKLSAKLFCNRVYFQNKCFNYLIFLGLITFIHLICHLLFQYIKTCLLMV